MHWTWDQVTIEVPQRFANSQVFNLCNYYIDIGVPEVRIYSKFCMVKPSKIIIRIKTTCKKILQKIFRNANRPRKNKKITA